MCKILIWMWMHLANSRAIQNIRILARRTADARNISLKSALGRDSKPEQFCWRSVNWGWNYVARNLQAEKPGIIVPKVSAKMTKCICFVREWLTDFPAVYIALKISSYSPQWSEWQCLNLHPGKGVDLFHSCVKYRK
jgi:hypothetical protein